MNTPSPNSMKRDPGRGSAYLPFLKKRCRDFFFFCLLLGVYVAFITLTVVVLRSSLRRSEEGYGLRNVANRVRLAYGENYGVRIESQEGYGTTVSVRIPVNE